jgi:hypothetical protein
MSAKAKSWPLAQAWHRALWRAWDKLTPNLREIAENGYERRVTERGLYRHRPVKNARHGKHT